MSKQNNPRPVHTPVHHHTLNRVLFCLLTILRFGKQASCYRFLFPACLFIIIFISPVSAQFINGGFETGNLDDWVSASDGTGSVGVSSGYAYNSNYGARLHMNGYSGTHYVWITQDVDLTNIKYISFDYKDDYDTNHLSGESRLYVNGVSLFSTDEHTSWGHADVLVSGYSGVCTVKFECGKTNYGYQRWYLDNIELVYAPYVSDDFNGDFELGWNVDGYTIPSWIRGERLNYWPLAFTNHKLDHPYNGDYGLYITAGAQKVPFSGYNIDAHGWVTQLVNMTGADTLHFTAKAEHSGTWSSEGFASVAVGDRIVYVPSEYKIGSSGEWSDYEINVSAYTGFHNITISAWAECDQVIALINIQSIEIDDIYLTGPPPEDPDSGNWTDPDTDPNYTHESTINYNPDTSTTNITHQLDTFENFLYVDYNLSYEYRLGKCEILTTDSNSREFTTDIDTFIENHYHINYVPLCNVSQGVLVQLINWSNDGLSYGVIASDYTTVFYNCTTADIPPDENVTPLPTETPTPIPTPPPDNGSNETGEERINSSFMPDYYQSVDDMFSNLTTAMKDIFGFLLGPIVDMTGYVDDVDDTFTSSFAQASDHKVVLFPILSSFFQYLPPKVSALITFSLILIVILLILRGN